LQFTYGDYLILLQ